MLPNDLIIVMNHGYDEDVQDTKDELESPRDVHNNVEIQINLEL
jgi:hypothetical protein